MTPLILQHTTSEQVDLLNLASFINKPYADKFGFNYQTDVSTLCPERSAYWEKIAYLRQLLPTLEEGRLVVWEDADSLNVGNEDMHHILPLHSVFGMVQMRGGTNMERHIPWYNSGVLAMRNFGIVREFLDRVWERNHINDEDALNYELRHRGLVIGDGKAMTSLDIKWNCWNNNMHLCDKPVVRSFHGIKGVNKLDRMKEFLKIGS